MKIAIYAGGTLGHIKPAIELAKELRLKNSNIIFIINSNAHDEIFRMVREQGFPYKTIRAGYFKQFGWKMIIFPFLFILGLYYSLKLLREFDFVIGMGSYVSVPGVVSAKILGKKIAICEQNVAPGRANKHLARFADLIFLSFEESKKYIPKYTNKCRVYGNPVSKELFKLRSKLPQNKTLLVFGGTNGANDLNQAIYNNIFLLVKNGINVIHLTGNNKYDSILNKYKSKDIDLKKIELLASTNKIDKYYSRAEVILCRAGAGSLFEISATGRMAIFVPHPNSKDDHQKQNALIAKKLGYSFLESKNLEKKLIPEINKLMKKSKVSFKRLARIDSAKRIAEEIISI